MSPLNEIKEVLVKLSRGDLLVYKQFGDSSHPSISRPTVSSSRPATMTSTGKNTGRPTSTDDQLSVVLLLPSWSEPLKRGMVNRHAPARPYLFQRRLSLVEAADFRNASRAAGHLQSRESHKSPRHTGCPLYLLFDDMKDPCDAAADSLCPTPCEIRLFIMRDARFPSQDRRLAELVNQRGGRGGDKGVSNGHEQDGIPAARVFLERGSVFSQNSLIGMLWMEGASPGLGVRSTPGPPHAATGVMVKPERVVKSSRLRRICRRSGSPQAG